jgi:molybdopterin-biosynthesis enzyme MoeA-like protein
MPIGAYIIGDEILRGKRQDRHFTKLVELLAARGLRLDWATYLADKPAQLTDAFRRSMGNGDTVFSFGGIGATPDDHTRQAAARAAGVELEIHPEGLAEVKARFGDQITPNRLQLIEFPVGSRIIPNPFNRIPGFSFGDHHFVPGFPQMAWPMVEWVLETVYSGLFHQVQELERACIVWEGNEGTLIDLMRRIETDFPGTTVFSLPSFGDAAMRRHVELGVRGEPDQVNAAYAVMLAEVAALGFDIQEL